MRIAALAFGVLAGLVASLILALGGLDVAASAVPADRQAQLVRFGLFLIGNMGFFGAALTLASPLAGGILLLLGAVAWVAAALLTHHSTDMVLVLPPALMLMAAILSLVAHFRRPAVRENEPQIIAPLRGAETEEADADQPEVTIPAFAAEPPAARGPAFQRPVETRDPAEDWDPRRRRAPPPRAKPAFRQPDEDEEDEQEESGFTRFALGVSSVLSFGLYAALAGAAVLIFWTLRSGDTPRPAAVATADVPSISASSEPPPAPPSSEPSSSEPAPVAVVAAPSAPAPDATSPEPTSSAELEISEPLSEDNFGDIVVSDDPLAPPRLAQEPGPVDLMADTPSSEAPIELEPSLEPSEDPSEAAVVAEVVEALPPPTSTPTVGTTMPYTMSARMAALRSVRGTGPIAPAEPGPPPDDTTGL